MAVKTASGSLHRRRNPGSICPRKEERDGGSGVFLESSSPPRASIFFLIYEGVRRRPEARRCPRPIWGAHAATVPGRVGPPLLALRHPLVSIFCPTCFFSIKSDVVFFHDFIFCKNSQGRDFAKNSVRNSSFIQMGKDPRAIYVAKCLEKWMHFGCISCLFKSDPLIRFSVATCAHIL